MFGFLALAPTPLTPPAPPAAVELIWEAPSECPTGAEVEALYEALLTGAPSGAGVLEAHAVITNPRPGRWRLELTTRLGQYTDVRKITGARCQDLAEATATLFAFALEPGLTPPPEVPEPVPEPAPIVEPFPPPEPPVAAPLAPPPRPPRAPTRRPVYTTLSVGPELGATPGFTARLAAGFGYNWRWARFQADVAWIAPRSTPARLGEARVQAVTGALRGCGMPGGDRWSFPICAGAEVGGTIVRVDRGSGVETLSAPWFGPLISAGAIRTLGRFGLFVGLEGMGAIIQAEFRLSNDAVFTPASGSIRALAGLQINFF